MPGHEGAEALHYGAELFTVKLTFGAPPLKQPRLKPMLAIRWLPANLAVDSTTVTNDPFDDDLTESTGAKKSLPLKLGNPPDAPHNAFG